MARYLNDFIFGDRDNQAVRVADEITTETASKAVELMFISEYAIHADWTINSFSAQNFVDGDVTVATDTVNISSHGFTEDLVVQLTTTGTLPAGLSTGTDYRINVVDADNIRFKNASTGAIITITGASGGGTHTVTAEALANASLKLQGSNAPGVLTWQDIPNSSTNITADDGVLINVSNAGYGFVRAVVSLDSGSIDITAAINGKSE